MQISVIFASPSTRNKGMQTVDAAWDEFVDRNFPKANSTKYRFDKISWDGGQNSGYQCLTDSFDEVIQSDLIVYWGDFLHMKHYQERKAKQLVDQGYYSDYNDALSFVMNTLLLSGQDDNIINKTISFGTNIMLDSKKKFYDEPYHTYLTRLISDCKAWLPRDLYSANIGRNLRDDDSLTLGSDCALILSPLIHDKNNEITHISGKKKECDIGVFFGRSNVNHTYAFGRFSKRFGDEINGRTIWIPWIDRKPMRHKARSYICKNWMDEYLASLPKNHTGFPTWLQSFDLIITDTYHLSLCSWASGTPAICIANTTGRGRSSGAKFSWQDKRYMFYQMIDSIEFFVHSEEVHSIIKRKQRINHLSDILNKERHIEWPKRQLTSQAKNAEELLINSIGSLEKSQP